MVIFFVKKVRFPLVTKKCPSILVDIGRYFRPSRYFRYFRDGRYWPIFNTQPCIEVVRVLERPCINGWWKKVDGNHVGPMRYKSALLAVFLFGCIIISLDGSPSWLRSPLHVRFHPGGFAPQLASQSFPCTFQPLFHQPDGWGTGARAWIQTKTTYGGRRWCIIMF